MKKHTYHEILNYLIQKGWTKGPKRNTFCPGRNYFKKGVYSLMLSAICPNIQNNPRSEIAVIPKDIKYGYTKLHELTLQYIWKGSELYRIDYDKKGWHIDSKKFKLKHRKTTDIHNWKQAINLIIKYGFALPFQYLNQDEINHFTNPENMMQ